MTAPFGEHMARPYIEGHFYEQDMLNDLSLLAKGGVWMDVGACIGNHSVWFAMMCEADLVLAFEPNIAALRYLIHNIDLNSLGGKIMISTTALGNRDGHLVMGQAWKESIGAFSAFPESGGDCSCEGVLKRPVTRLDSILLHGLDVIKIDAEASTAAVLLGALVTLDKFRPLVVCEAQDEEHLGVIDEILLQISYVRHPSFKWGWTPNYLWTRPASS